MEYLKKIYHFNNQLKEKREKEMENGKISNFCKGWQCNILNKNYSRAISELSKTKEEAVHSN